jgi:flavin-dependent dehydrogenase
VASRIDGADVVVVGGGPAGLAVAIEARMAGLEVIVIERLDAPIDRACGEGLMPDGVACLERLGVSVPCEGRAPFYGIRYLDGDIVAEGRFPGSPGAGIRRTFLHAAMAERAAALGADLRWGMAVSGIDVDAVLLADRKLTGRWLVAADGRTSRVRRWAGLDGTRARRRRIATRRHFSIKPWTDCVEVYWADLVEAYVTPVGPERVGVALLWEGDAETFDHLMLRFPELACRLATAPAESRDRGAGPLEQRARAVVDGRLALVGDASGYLDPITGEGLTLAFHQARAVVAAMVRGDLAGYARAHRRIGRAALALTRLLLAVERRPKLRRRMVRALAADPNLFSRLLAIHVRELPASGFGLDGLGRLMRGLLTA